MILNKKAKKEFIKKVEKIIAHGFSHDMFYNDIAVKIYAELETIPESDLEKESGCGGNCKCNK